VVADEHDIRPINAAMPSRLRPLKVNPVRPVAPVRARVEAEHAYQDGQSPHPARKVTDSDHVPVRQVMSRPALTLEVNATLEAAAALMQSRQIDHVPVVAAQRLVGLVTRGDLVDRMLSTPNTWRDLPLASVMTRQVVAIGPADSLRHASERLIESGHGGLPVVDEDDTVVGFLAARDLLTVLVSRAPLSLWV
jgi:CBS domain-containing protein